MGPIADAIELGEVAAELPPRPVVAHTVALVGPRRTSLLQELSGPLKLLGLAACIMALDWGHTVVTGTLFQLGHVRAFWIAAPLAVLGLVKLLFRLFEH